MKNPIITCPRCSAVFTLQSKTDQSTTDWSTLSFSCRHCGQSLLLNNLNENSSQMKKIQFDKNCTHCNEANTIISLESAVGKTITKKCEHCKQGFAVLVPVSAPAVTPTPAEDKETNRTFVQTAHTAGTALVLEVAATDQTNKQVFEINNKQVSVGRKNDTTLQPDVAIETEDLMMSRIHAAIRYHEKKDAYSIKDAGSTNKVYFNGEALDLSEERILHNGTQIRLGKTTITIRLNYN